MLAELFYLRIMGVNLSLKVVFIIIAGFVLLKIMAMGMEQRSIYYPVREIFEDPKSIGIPFEDLYFKTGDGETINGWLVIAKDAKATVLYCHGNAGNISHRLHRVKFFYDMGLNLLIFDYRGYGNSSGRPSEQGLYKDVQAVYDFLVSREDISRDGIIAYGKSLGGSVAAELCLRRKARALVLESSFASTVMIAKEILPFLPIKLLVSQRFDAINKVRNISIPKLILHGRDDEVIRFRHSERLYKSAAEPKEFLPFNGGHNDEIFVTSDLYKEKLRQFILSSSEKSSI